MNKSVRTYQEVASLPKPDKPVLKNDQASFSVSYAGTITAGPLRPVPEAGHISFLGEGPNQLNFYSNELGDDLYDWRTLMDYLSNPSAKVDKNIRYLANNYIMVNGDLH
jgi:hypothetical protein